MAKCKKCGKTPCGCGKKKPTSKGKPTRGGGKKIGY